MRYSEQHLSESLEIIKLIDVEIIEGIVDLLVDVKSSRGRLFVLGVGGSAANASHAVNDFRKILNIESYAITDNVSELTARINDDGWDTSFSNWLKVSKLNFNDAIIIFSVGGGNEKTSQNIVKAIDYAKSCNTKILSIVSRDGGYSKQKSDACVLIPVISTDRITPHAEEFQGILWHLIVTLMKENYEN
jgi:D-sedoheptulose 7-phosphate isomerase